MKATRDWREIAVTDIEGFLLGNSQDEAAGTGCTAILCPSGAFAGVDVRGSAPASREHALLSPVNMVQQIHGVMLSGGSAFGLACADGAMAYLAEKEIGFDTGFGIVPIVCASSLFDLPVGDGTVRPDKAMGYAACEAAFAGDFQKGNHGAGTGASVGKYLGMEQAMKGGLGTFAVKVGEIKVGAVVAVNCLGDVYDIDTEERIAGMLDEEGKSFGKDMIDIMLLDMAEERQMYGGNTTIGCILTNAKLDKTQATKLAQVTHDGYAQAIRPVHTSADGDTIYALATGEKEVSPDVLGAVASEVMARAIMDAVRSAAPAYGLPAASSL